MSRRRHRRRNENQQHQTVLRADPRPQAIVLREAVRVDRLAYTRSQAAEALGISRSTFDRRVLPLIEMARLPWGTRLVPVDELERLLADGRQPAAQAVARPRRRPGRKPGLASEVVARVQREHAAGKALAAIARGLNADGVPTSQGGRRWWPSTVRGVLARAGGEPRVEPWRQVT